MINFQKPWFCGCLRPDPYSYQRLNFFSLSLTYGHNELDYWPGQDVLDQCTIKNCSSLHIWAYLLNMWLAWIKCAYDEHTSLFLPSINGDKNVFGAYMVHIVLCMETGFNCEVHLLRFTLRLNIYWFSLSNEGSN